MKIQPSLDRVKVNGLAEFEIEETTSNSETRLFNFRSPEDTTSIPAAAANPHTELAIETRRNALINYVLRHGLTPFNTIRWSRRLQAVSPAARSGSLLSCISKHTNPRLPVSYLWKKEQ